jgi:TolB-like protein
MKGENVVLNKQCRFTWLLLILFLLFSGSFAAAETRTIAVLPFTAPPALKEQSEVLNARISAAVAQNGQYTVVEADKRDTLIEELKFSLNDLSSDEVELRLGELLAARYVVTGTLRLQAGRFELSLQLVSVESGAAVSSLAESFSSFDELLLNTDGLAGELLGAGTFRKKRINTISVDIGAGLYPTDSEILALGLEAGVLYRAAENIYIGGWIGGVMKRDTTMYLNGGLRALYGDKTNSLAVSLDLGFFPSVGVYYHNLYLSYSPMFLFGKKGQYVKAGYSIGIN